MLFCCGPCAVGAPFFEERKHTQRGIFELGVLEQVPMLTEVVAEKFDDVSHGDDRRSRVRRMLGRRTKGHHADRVAFRVSARPSAISWRATSAA